MESTAPPLTLVAGERAIEIDDVQVLKALLLKVRACAAGASLTR